MPHSPGLQAWLVRKWLGSGPCATLPVTSQMAAGRSRTNAARAVFTRGVRSMGNPAVRSQRTRRSAIRVSRVLRAPRSCRESSAAR